MFRSAAWLILGWILGLIPLRDSLASEPIDIVFVSKVDQSEQRYVEWLPRDHEETTERDAVIVLHGHGSDRWQFINQNRDECRGVRDVAIKYGLWIVAPDYRGTKSWMGPKAEADVVQIIEEFRSRRKVGRVYMAGGSMGGTAALTFATLHPNLVSGICCLNGTANLVEYDQFQEAIRSSFGGSKEEVPEEYRKRSAEFWPELLTMPIAVTTGGKDRTVPPESIARLISTLKQRDAKVFHKHRADGGHATTYADTLEAMEFLLHARDQK